MKLRTTYFILILICTGTFVNGQEEMNLSLYEKIILFSDRNLYVAGENISFSAYILQNNSDKQTLSRILYCEIITPDGLRISSGKFLVSNFNVSGSLDIPSDVLSGNYYLRAYTKYLRNAGPAKYSYIPVRIVNPVHNDLLSQGNDYKGEKSQGRYQNEGEIFSIRTSKSRYTRQDTISILIKAHGTINDQFENLCLSVVPELAFSPDSVTLPISGDYVNKNYYQPENLGISITGKLIDKATDHGIKNTRINLSIIGKGEDFMAMKTDSTGGFYFRLPDYTGRHDLFLCSENLHSDPLLLIDNDFCTIPVSIPAAPFRLTGGERETVLKMAMNQQVREYFQPRDRQREDTLKMTENSFYGKPDEIIYIDKYIRLPDLEEYFNSLTSHVKIRKRQGEKYVKVTGPQTTLSDYEPLLMVDFVATEDLQGILAVNPAAVSRIEIVNSLYLKGNLTFGGIISIISKNNDFAGINLPESGLFVNYGFLTPAYTGNKPEPGKPDTRNTLYWDPQLSLSDANNAEIAISVPDTPGKYSIILRGITSEGKTFRQTATFEVNTTVNSR